MEAPRPRSRHSRARPDRPALPAVIRAADPVADQAQAFAAVQAERPRPWAQPAIYCREPRHQIQADRRSAGRPVHSLRTGTPARTGDAPQARLRGPAPRRAAATSRARRRDPATHPRQQPTSTTFSGFSLVMDACRGTAPARALLIGRPACLSSQQPDCPRGMSDPRFRQKLPSPGSSR
jgi:hypothetical protein